MGKEQDLLVSVRSRDTDNLQKLLCKQKHASSKNKFGTPKKLNVNFQDSDGMTALHQASLMGEVDIMKMLIDSNALVDIKDMKGMRPLHYAAWQGKELEAVAILLKAGSSANEAANDGNTPLHLASEHGHLNVVSQLLQYRGDPMAENSQFKTPLDLACEFGRVKVVELLIKSAHCNRLLVGNPQDDMADNNRSTCLHLAARNGHVSVIKLLLQAGADINRQTLKGTCLHEAALFGKIEVVRHLLNSGVDVNKTNSYDQTALDIVNKFTGNRAAKELKQLLKEASYVVQARAVKEYIPAMHDPNHITLKEGDVLTVLEQHPSGMWKGYISRADGQVTKTGYFPASAVVLVDSQDSDRDSGISPQQSYPSQSFSQASFPGQQTSGTSPAERTAEWLGRYVGEATDTRSASPSRDSPTPGGSNRNSTASNNSGGYTPHGYVTANGHHPPHTPHHHTHHPSSHPQTPTGGSSGGGGTQHSVHRLSGQSYESGVSGVSRQSYHSASSSSLGSLDRLEESGYSSTVNVHDLVLSGLTTEEILRTWLADLHFDEYYDLFMQSGYDMPTISHMTPQDLAAIGISNPKHRKRLKAEINKLRIQDGFPEEKPKDIGEWLQALDLLQYLGCLSEECQTMDGILDIECEDLEEIGITKLGHQKKIQCAIERIKRVQSGGKRLSAMDKQSSEALDSPGGTGSTHYQSKWPGTGSAQTERSKSVVGWSDSPSENIYSSPSPHSNGPLELTTFQQPKDEGGTGNSSAPTGGQAHHYHQPSSVGAGRASLPGPRGAAPDIVAIHLNRALSLHQRSGSDGRIEASAIDPPPPYSFYQDVQRYRGNDSQSVPVDGDATPTNERRRIPSVNSSATGEATDAMATIRRPSAKVSPRMAPKAVAKVMAKPKTPIKSPAVHELSEFLQNSSTIEATSGSTAYSCSTLPRKFSTRSHNMEKLYGPLTSDSDKLSTSPSSPYHSPMGGQSPAHHSPQYSMSSPWGKAGPGGGAGVRKVPPPPPPKRTNSIKSNMHKVGRGPEIRVDDMTSADALPPPPPDCQSPQASTFSQSAQMTGVYSQQPASTAGHSNCVQSLAERFQSRQQQQQAESGYSTVIRRATTGANNGTNNSTVSNNSGNIQDTDSFPPPPPALSSHLSSSAMSASPSSLPPSGAGSYVAQTYTQDAGADFSGYEDSNPLNDVIQQLEQSSQNYSPPAATASSGGPPPIAPKPSASALSKDAKTANRERSSKSAEWHDNGSSSQSSDSGSEHSEGSSVSTVSGSHSDTNTLPFANENVGTIKQRNPANKPSIVCSVGDADGGDMANDDTDGSFGLDGEQHRSVELNSSVFEDGTATVKRKPKLSAAGSGKSELKKVPPPVAPKRKDLPNGGQSAVGPAESGDVLNDIDHMLQDLTNELDAMLELEIS